MPHRIDAICRCLQRHKQRATYGALGEFLGYEKPSQGRNAGNRMKEYPQKPFYSWIVARRTGRPTGYTQEEMHSELCANTQVITTGDELRKWLAKNCEQIS